MSAGKSIIEQYEEEFGYKPETLQKLHNFVKEKGISMKYSLVKKAFESMKQDLRTTKPKRDTIKAEATNLDVNKSKIDIDLIPTPEAEEAEENKQKDNKGDKDEKDTENTQNESSSTTKKQWKFDITKATEAIEVFEKLNKKLTINAEILPQILEWANNDENKYEISLSELKQAYAQKKDYEAMDFPSNTKKKKKKKKKNKDKDKEDKKEENNDDQKLDLIETQTLIEFCTNDIIKDLLMIYKAKWDHEPDTNQPQQLFAFIDEQGLIEKDDKFKILNFEKIKKFCDSYNEYIKSAEIENIKIKSALKTKEIKKDKKDFNCRDILNKYIETHGEPKDTTMFYKYVLELGFDMEFKELDDEYNKAKGIKKKKKAKVKITKTSKRLQSLYKKGKSRQ